MRRLEVGDKIHCRSLDEYNELVKLCRRDGVIVGIPTPQKYGKYTYYIVVENDTIGVELHFGNINSAYTNNMYLVDNFKVDNLSFLEVMSNISEGETWVCTDDYYDIKSIQLDNGYVVFNKGNSGKKLTVGNTTRFKLVPKYVTFAEAFEEYNNGKTIESESGAIYRKHPTLKVMFNEDEINGKWVIIDEQ